MTKTGIEVVKIGGYLINEPKGLTSFLDAFVANDHPKVLIHGGGRLATEIAQKLDIPIEMVEGRRITDSATLQVAVMAYAGWANKEIVAKLQARGSNAIGLSGADGDVIRAHKRLNSPIDFGWVGDIDEVNDELLLFFIERNIVPVICAITHDGKGQLLNTNADTIAAQVALSLAKHKAVHLAYCFEYDGVVRSLSTPKNVIAHLTEDEFMQMKAVGTIHAGMIPKLSNGFAAAKGGCTVRVCGVANLWSRQNSTLLCP